MDIKVEIDSGSGFCYGVIRAVNTAEIQLKKGPLYSLGAIVHNNYELERLRNIGLEIIDAEQMAKLKDSIVLIRAHGEPPQTYMIAKENNIKLLDCTCPVVLKLQELIKETYYKDRDTIQTATRSTGSHLSSLHSNKGNVQIVIFGKDGHAEVNGLIGQVNGDAIIVDIIKPTVGPDSAGAAITGLDKIDYSRPIHIFSQTTKDPDDYQKICSAISIRQQQFGLQPTIHNTICKRVEQRHNNLKHFAASHSVIILVSGVESSNGKVLYELCRSVNARSYFIQNIYQIERDWFKEGDNVGICGATSTPMEQLESVAKQLQILW